MTEEIELPPPIDDDPDRNVDWPNWKEETYPLNYPGRDIRVIFEPNHTRYEREPAEFGDFDPKGIDPDPEVWPLEEYDPGYPADVEDLHLIMNSFPAPHVAWVTEDYLIKRYGYNPTQQELRVDELPKWARPNFEHDQETVTLKVGERSNRSLEMTDDRIETMKRIAQLWNGKVVRGSHLLLDKCPGWCDIFGDLDQEQLKELFVGPHADIELVKTFGNYDWYGTESGAFIKSERIIRKKVWYSPTMKGRTLINRWETIPDLKGDPAEGLCHRFTVGLGVVDLVSQDANFETYYEMNDKYTVDIAADGSRWGTMIGEVMTDHNNWEEYRRILRKIATLDELDVTPITYFDKRSTAYKVFNHWHRTELAELPNGTFESEYSISNGRKVIQEAYEASDDWPVADWYTTSSLWSEHMESGGSDIGKSTIKSLDW